MNRMKRPTISATSALLSLAALVLASGCTSSHKAKEIADQPVMPGQTLEFFGRGLHSNPHTPKAVNRESYAPQYADEVYFDDVYTK